MESSSSTDPARIKVGRLGKPHGLDGFLGLYVDSADLIHFEPGSTVTIGEADFTVRSIRQGKKGPQVAFEEVADRHQAETLRGREVSVPARRRLGEGEYWPDDLIGLEVRPGGGEIVGVSHGAAQDRLIVSRGGSTFEVPFVEELVPELDLEAGWIEITEIEGLSSPSDPQ